MKRVHRPAPVAAAAFALLLAGCSSLPPDAGVNAVQGLVDGRTGVATRIELARAPDAPQPPQLQALLAQPLQADGAVRIALLNNPVLQEQLAALQMAEAEGAQAGSLPNPHFALGRFRSGDTTEIERILRIDLVALISTPWRAARAARQAEQQRMQTAQTVVRLAADTRKAWVQAVAASQSVRYLRDVKEAAEASGELARRLARIGNWSRLQQARQQVFLADATAQLARAEQTAFSTRERLVQLMGLWGEQTGFVLPDRLPDLPASLPDMPDLEARALRERLDVRAALAQNTAVAESLGLVRATGFVNALDLGTTRNTSFNTAAHSTEIKRGLEVEVPVPLFDWGQARSARAEASYLQSVARVRSVAVLARSEAREAWHGWRTAYDLARYHRDEIVPLRRFINDELVLRYNGMLTSVFDLLADTRQQALAVNASIGALRDFWLADAQLQTVLTGTSPGALGELTANGSPLASESKGH